MVGESGDVLVGWYLGPWAVFLEGGDASSEGGMPSCFDFWTLDLIPSAQDHLDGVAHVK